MNGRYADGTFTFGSAGRPKGARKKTTQAAMALFDGEADANTLIAGQARCGQPASCQPSIVHRLEQSAVPYSFRGLSLSKPDWQTR